MKKYIIPTINVANIENEVILAGSGGMSDGSTLNESTGTGPRFGKERDGLFDWNNDNEE